MKRERKKKRPYRTPTVVTEKLYERYGLACGKDNPRNPICFRGLRS